MLIFFRSVYLLILMSKRRNSQVYVNTREVPLNVNANQGARISCNPSRQLGPISIPIPGQEDEVIWLLVKRRPSLSWDKSTFGGSDKLK